MEYIAKLTGSEIETIMLSFLYLRGEATEDEILGFARKCDEVLQTANMIKRAANREIHIGWSDISKDFIFSEKEPRLPAEVD